MCPVCGPMFPDIVKLQLCLPVSTASVEHLCMYENNSCKQAMKMFICEGPDTFNR